MRAALGVSLLLICTAQCRDPTKISNYGFPSLVPFPLVASGKTIAIIGAPFGRGQVKGGVQYAPDMIRRKLVPLLRSEGCSFLDYRNVQFPGPDPRDNLMDCEKAKNSYSVADAAGRVWARVRDAAGRNQVPLVLGGDHSVSIGSLLGHYSRRPNLVFIYIDAHGDINTIKSTPSGNMHGMPLSFVLKAEQLLNKPNRNCPAMAGYRGTIAPKNMAYIGTRDLDPPEVEFLRLLNIPVFNMSTIRSLGPKKVVEVALNLINPQRNRPLHVSFDIDSLDPSVAPATGVLAPGGIAKEDALIMAEELSASGVLRGVDIVEVNPYINVSPGDGDKTVSLAAEIAMAFVGNVCAKGPL